MITHATDSNAMPTNDEHLPNLEFAGDWLDDAIDLLHAYARGDANRLGELTVADAQSVAHTLADIRARAVIVPRDVVGVALIACQIVAAIVPSGPAEPAEAAALALARII